MFTFKAHDGTELFERRWTAKDRPRAHLVIIHGYGEHSGRYDRLGGELQGHGYSVYALDLRGHGRSGGTRGFVQRFGDFLGDVGGYLDRLRKEGPIAPMVLLGHSFGGLVSSHYVLEHPGEVHALVLSSPYFGLALKVPKWELMAGEFASSLLPKLALPTGIKGSDVSHDPRTAHEYENDPLVNKKATARWFTEANAAQAAILRRAHEIKTACLVLQAGSDRVADASQTQAVFERIGSTDKLLRMYPGLYHEVLNETEAERAQVVGDLTQWLSAHLS